MAPEKTRSGVEYEPSAIEASERRFWREVWESVPAGVAAEHGVELAGFGPVQATVVRELAAVESLNLVLGATEPGAVAGGHLEAALAWTAERGVRPYVPVAPARPTSEDAEAVLRAAGLSPGYAWTKFVRDPHLPRFAPAAGIEVVEIGASSEEPFATIVATAFGMPAWCAELFAGLPGREGWRCYVAKLDGAAYATAAMLLDGPNAQLGFAATLEPARGRGCQPALLHRRIIDAADAGAKLLAVETGERSDDQPAPSYRNILRAGFEAAYRRPNWVQPGS